MSGVSLIENALAGARGRAAQRSRAPGVLEDFQGHYLVGLAALLVAYYAAAHLGYALGFSGPIAAIVWLPAGVGIAFLYLAGLRFWPGVLIGDLLVNNYSALPVGSAIGQTIGNVLEIVIAAALMRAGFCPGTHRSRRCPPWRPSWFRSRSGAWSAPRSVSARSSSAT